MRVWWLPALVCVVSILSTHAAFVISLSKGQVPACIPYFDGCTSISAAARQEPAVHLFRATMIPVAVFIAATWWLAGQWLRQAGDRSPAWNRTVITVGVIGAIFLVLYATFMGTHGLAYGVMRRYGVIVFFGFTALDQMIVTARLQRLRRGGHPAASRRTERVMLTLMTVMLGIGLANIPAAHFLDGSGLENIIEWTFALLMMAWFGVLAGQWKRGGLAVRTGQIPPRGPGRTLIG
jgi:hypothetical protein